MSKFFLKNNYSTSYQWEELLNPYLAETGLKYDGIVLLVALSPYKSYVGFVRVCHIPFDEEKRGIWFSNFIKVGVDFNGVTMDIKLYPVHFRNEFLNWNEGDILVDNRRGRSPLLNPQGGYAPFKTPSNEF